MKDIYLKYKKQIIVGCIITSMLGGLVATYSLGANSTKDDVVNLELPGAYEYIEEVKSKDVKKDVEKIRGILDKLQTTNSYFQINTTEDSYAVALFNSKGQGFVQDTKNGTVSVFRGDNKSVLYSDTVGLVYDINVIQMLDFGLEMVDEGVSKLYKDKDVAKANEAGDEFDVRYVDIVGYDNINKLYSKIDKEFGDLMVTNLKANTMDKGEVTLRLIYVTSGENNFSGGCNIIIGEEEYSSWNFDGYIELYDWELGKEWFEYDYDNIENTDKLEEMLKELSGELDDMMHKYSKDNNLPDAEEVAENPITKEEANEPIVGTGEEVTEDNPIVKEDLTGHYHEDGTFHPSEAVETNEKK